MEVTIIILKNQYITIQVVVSSLPYLPNRKKLTIFLGGKTPRIVKSTKSWHLTGLLCNILLDLEESGRHGEVLSGSPCGMSPQAVTLTIAAVG